MLPRVLAARRLAGTAARAAPGGAAAERRGGRGGGRGGGRVRAVRGVGVGARWDAAGDDGAAAAWLAAQGYY